MNSITVGYTVPNKITNQDAFSVFKNERLGISGVAVADGIGSFKYSEFASELLCLKAKEYVEKYDKDWIDIGQLFYYLNTALLNGCNEFISSNNLENTNKSSLMGSTFILCIEYNDRFEIGYIGNGSIFHWRGNFHLFPESTYPLPWSTLNNLLNPDTLPNNFGKESLYKFFSPVVSNETIVPNLITLYKDNNKHGDIIFLSTDGIFSTDSAASIIGIIPDGNRPKYLEERWLPFSPEYAMIVDSFRKLFISEATIVDYNSLNNSLKDTMDFMKLEKMFDDDATVGIIFSEFFLSKFS